MEEVVAWERDLAVSTGVGIDRMREIRLGLPKGMVVAVKGRVGFTVAGLEEVARLLKETPADSSRKKRRGVVTRVFANPQLLEARVGDDLVVVRVRDNSLFVPKQQVPLLGPVEGSRVWWLGCRPPEVKGRLRGVNWGAFQ